MKRSEGVQKVTYLSEVFMSAYKFVFMNVYTTVSYIDIHLHICTVYVVHMSSGGG